MGDGSQVGKVGFETARLRLARLKLEGAQARAQASRSATIISACALKVDRVGIWLFRDNGLRLDCVHLYVRDRDRHSSGGSLHESQCPTYMKALRERRAIAAADARSNPVTHELLQAYLVPNNIGAMLDSPIIRGGEVVGVVCHEQLGTAREWTQQEIDFASSVADMTTLIFEQADRLELEALMREDVEHQLASQKMEALGRLARAVAHDFNNVLTTVGLLAARLRRHGDPQVSQAAADIAESVDLSARLAQQLLAFGREGGAGSGEVKLDDLLTRLHPVLSTMVGKSIRLDLRVSATQPIVVGDPSQLEQVVLNLALNARDACGERGMVGIALRDPRLDDDVPMDHVVLEVADDGAGMDDDTQARIFEPYFTTKPHGTGLGLATVYAVIRRLGGRIAVFSSPGRGTTFTVSLPRAVRKSRDPA